MHPAIARLSEQSLNDAVAQQQDAGGLVVYEAPLLYEVGAESRVDKVLAVVVDDALQLQRLQLRDCCDLDAAKSRVNSQMSQSEKARRADYVIDNSTGLSDLQCQVDAVFSELCTQ